MKNINKYLIVIIASVIGLSIPSGLAAAAAFFLGKNVLGWFFVTATVTAVIGWLWNIAQELRYKVIRESIAAQNRMADAFQNVSTGCAYCNTTNIIRVALGKDNKFTCKNCNSVNTIEIQFTTARTTVPIIADVALNDLMKKMDEQPHPQSQSTINQNITIEGSRNE